MGLVFLHSIGLDEGCWQFIDPSLLSGAVTYTMQGHGRREQPPAGLTMTSMARDVLDHTNGPIDLVGLSMGGGVAQVAALLAPGRVRSLVTACSSAGGRGGEEQRRRAATVEAVGMVGILDETLRRWFTQGALDTPGHPAVEYVRSTLLSDSPAAFAAAWRALAEHDTVARLPQLSVPTTVIHAEQDAASSVESRRAMAQSIPRGRLAVVPGPHLLPLERPDVFAMALAEHLEWIEAGAASDSQLNG